MILIAFRRPKNDFWEIFVFDHFVTPFPSNVGVFVPFPVCLISLSFRTFHLSIPLKTPTNFFLLLIDVTKLSKTKWSKINRKSNLFFKNLIFNHFYTDDPLAKIIGREMILWQDLAPCSYNVLWWRPLSVHIRTSLGAIFGCPAYGFRTDRWDIPASGKDT